jgi:hypothetical protein
MKGLNDVLARRYYALCDDIRNSLNSEELNFRVGVACGFASGLFLTEKIDIDCYKAMREYIDIVSELCKLGGDC